MHTPLASVWFDCDSTLAAIEGVDELLQWAPAALRTDIAALTEQAMNGTLPLAEVYETRLRLLAPLREQLDRIGELYVQRLVPDAAAVVAALRHLGKQVGIISGGLLPPVQQVARHLGIAEDLVHAVPIHFAADGSYLDFDRRSPLWRNGGKIDVVRALPASMHPLAFVGDGITDAETRDHVARFIGFGGVVVRPKVQALAHAFVTTKSLAGVLPHVLTAAERIRLAAVPEFAALLSPAKA
ncbi:MAG: HAD-IB family phosphatase [Planctomycetes bacterium]|nr:HAD-IB family phosphatase [Planctomycetota bacterium]